MGARTGWSLLLDGENPFLGDGRFPLPAYSEFMPAPWVGRKPYGTGDDRFVPPPDEHGFPVSEYEQLHQLRPGLAHIATHLAETVRRQRAGQHALSRALLDDNPYAPPELLARVDAFPARRVLILSLALSRTQDDKGRVRYTLFGSSDEGPARPFWLGLQRAPGEELPEAEGIALLRPLLARSAALDAADVTDGDGLQRAGFRILPAGADPDFPSWGDEPIPGWARRFVVDDSFDPATARVLLTFRPFARLPEPVRRAFLDGTLQLLPIPSSLAFFGHQGYRRLARELRSAMQIPLLHLFPRQQAASDGLRIPQSGWLDEPGGRGAARGQAAAHGPVVPEVTRTHRWNRTHRDEDEATALDARDRVTHALFSNDPDRLGLYDKPMARNVQLWTHDHRLLLDGPRHGCARIDAAARVVADGGHFGYRFCFPPMRVLGREIVWHLPLCAVLTDEGAEVVDGPTGYLTARSVGDAGPLDDAGAPPVALWPRLLRREPHLDAAELFEHDPGRRRWQTAYNARKVLETSALLGKPLTPTQADRLLTGCKDRNYQEWLVDLEGLASDRERGRRLSAQLRQIVSAGDPQVPMDSNTGLPRSITFAGTARREFEERYWKQVAFLAGGEFAAKDNADFVVRTDGGADRSLAASHDLARLGDHLHERYRALIEENGMAGRAFVGDHRFRWRTEFDFPWMGGWARNQLGHGGERNIVVVIPGRNRGEAVVMADHYDTAYMEDVYETARGGDLTRRSAAGADDNHSATTALLMAAEALLPLARDGKLARDVWLVHLTGEEFPADCLGARNLVSALVEGNLGLVVEERDGARFVDLSSTRVAGAFVLDMVAHNHDRDRYVFQISPGEGAAAARLAEAAFLANERWNQSVAVWNRAPERHRAGPSARTAEGPPETVAHPRLDGEIRPSWHFKSSLYNTDAQIFSDAGIPVVLFMENYDINRTGYHDTHDTMANIDLDYAAALVAIAIETVAETATAPEI